MKQNKLTKTELSLLLCLCSMCVVFVGMSMNFLVVAENEGKMPFIKTNGLSEICGYKEFEKFGDVSYWLFGDIIRVGKDGKYGIWSLGDIAMIFGMVCLLTFIYRFYILKYGKKKNAR